MKDVNNKLTIVIFILLSCIYTFFHSLTFFRPLIGHHDFLNGHVLTTVSIWRKEGILRSFFGPVYTYTSDMKVREDFGVQGKNGRMYYVSYPPLIFYIVYFLSFMPFIGLSIYTVKIASIFSFLLCIGLLYLYLHKRFGPIEAIVGISVFSLFPLSAYFLGNIFFVDIAVLPLLFLCFLIFLRLARKPSKVLYLLFFLTLFLVVMTEWIGIFLSVVLLIYVFMGWLKVQWSLYQKFLFLIITLLAPIFSLLLTLFIYLTSIDSVVLQKGMIGKFLFRSNMGSLQGTNMAEQIFTYLKNFIDRYIYHTQLGFGSYIWLIIAGIFLLFIIGKKKKIPLLGNDFKVITVFFFFPSFLHLIVFNQFHLAHDFGYLYFLFFITFLFVLSFQIAKKIVLLSHLQHKNRVIIGIAAMYILAIPITAFSGYNTYFRDWVWYPAYYTVIYENMRKNTQEHDLIVTNHDSTPMNWFYLQRNVIGNKVGKEVSLFQNTNPAIKNVYYMSDVYINTEESCGEKEIVDKDGLFICKLQ